MTQTRTINKQLADIISGTKTVEQIAAEKVSSYALEYYQASTPAEFEALRELREHMQTIEKAAPIVERKPVELVTCSCGHSVPAVQVMNASMGTCCPDCYDRMSE